MTELTKEQLIEEAKLKIAITKCHPNSGMARVEGELFKIALASLEAEPIAWECGENIILFNPDTVEAYAKRAEITPKPLFAAPPAAVVPDDASEPLALAYKELTPAIMRNHIAVFERYGITPNDSITTIHALRIALDGIERSDAMLHAGNFRENKNSSTNNFREIPETSTNSPVTPNGWISCSERMPDDGQWCVVNTEYGYY
ncbi:DUF551 domain-containing protein, partial [Escherichia coli]|uniref:DUF551 domain-containing protein n=1 Tax=Escherichia coli TaxID=562 RepID=UPI00313B110E